MIDHVSVGVSDMVRAAAFYDAVLATLGYRRTFEVEGVALAYGQEFPDFWIGQPLNAERPASAGNGAHVGFRAKSHSDIDAFHATALENGGRDAGAPGLRPDYGSTYYGAFVYDPDGNKLRPVATSRRRAAVGCARLGLLPQERN